MATHSGSIKFILETNLRAIVEETPSGDAYFAKHSVVNADFSGDAVGDDIDYTYDAASSGNNGRDITTE